MPGIARMMDSWFVTNFQTSPFGDAESDVMKRVTNDAMDAEAEALLAQFVHHFDLQKSTADELSKALAVRPATAREDLDVLWQEMETAKNPLELLRHFLH